MEKLVRSTFCAGMGVAFCLSSLVPDYMGKEAYLKLVEEHWVSEVFSVPFAITALVFCWFVYRYARSKILNACGEN